MEFEDGEYSRIYSKCIGTGTVTKYVSFLHISDIAGYEKLFHEITRIGNYIEVRCRA